MNVTRLLKRAKRVLDGEFYAALDLLYPRHCAGCDRVLNLEEKVICTHCEIQFPQTHFHLWQGNPLEKMLYGRMELMAATAFYRYTKGGKVQHAIHRLKYKGFPDIGVNLGRRFGTELKNSPVFASCQWLIPVPLHKSKLKKRGYNQAEMIARGMAQSMNIPVSTTHLVRTVSTETQTKKSRWERYKNVHTIFALNKPAELENKHILLVDDVITTGSTLEACYKTLKTVSGIKISVAALATPV